MKTISVAELNDHWSDATQWLDTDGEVLLTQDAKPVARLTKIQPPSTKKAFSLAEHQTWQRSVFGDEKLEPWVDKSLAQEREERTS